MRSHFRMRNVRHNGPTGPGMGPPRRDRGRTHISLFGPAHNIDNLVGFLGVSKGSYKANFLSAAHVYILIVQNIFFL